MRIEFASLGSGSSGNATLIRLASTLVMVDCGFSVKEARRRASLLGIELDHLSAIVVTHEHSDHIKGVAALARKYKLPVYMTPGTHRGRSYGDIPVLHYIQNHQPFGIGDLTVKPVAVPHDAADPVQYLFEAGATRVGVVTDLGSVTAKVVKAFHRCNGLLLEANHDVQMLAQGPYPRFLKQRVGGPWGHLNNQQTARFLRDLDTSMLQSLVIGHISAKNNSLALVKAALQAACLPIEPIFASQSEGFTWNAVESFVSQPAQLDLFPVS